MTYRYNLEFYLDGERPCIMTYKGSEFWGKLSANIPKEPLEPLEFFVKTYSENKSWWKEAILPFEFTNRIITTQFCVFPIYRLPISFIQSQYNINTYPSPQLQNLYNKYCVK